MNNNNLAGKQVLSLAQLSPSLFSLFSSDFLLGNMGLPNSTLTGRQKLQIFYKINLMSFQLLWNNTNT